VNIDVPAKLSKSMFYKLLLYSFDFVDMSDIKGLPRRSWRTRVWKGLGLYSYLTKVLTKKVLNSNFNRYLNFSAVNFPRGD
jgi:hypothetical protein